MIGTIDREQQRAARVAGAAYLVSTAAVVVAQFRIQAKIIVAGDAPQTARNILAHEGWFRLGIGLDLISCLATVVLLAALYVILRPVSRGLALLAAVSRLVYALMWVQITLNQLYALQLLNRPDYMWVFERERVEAWARLYLGAGFEQYYVGLLFTGVASTICGYLWLRSRYIPRALAAFGIVSSAWCAVCTFVFFLYPAFDHMVNLWWFDTPMGIFDIVTSSWLLIRGLRLPRTKTGVLTNGVLRPTGA
jgi:hypothetical protein